MFFGNTYGVKGGEGQNTSFFATEASVRKSTSESE